MTPSAQNALLKTLEEPAPRTVLVLVTARPSALLATLRSRCQRIEVARPEHALALRWLAATLGSAPPPRLLAVAGGSPLKALALAPHFAGPRAADDGPARGVPRPTAIEVTRAAADMQGEGLPTRLDWLEAWLVAAVQAAAGVANENPAHVSDRFALAKGGSRVEHNRGVPGIGSLARGPPPARRLGVRAPGGRNLAARTAGRGVGPLMEH